MNDPTIRDPWTALFAAAVAQSFCYRFKELDELDPWLTDDALGAAMNQLEDQAARIASDRGKIDLERFVRACLETFEAELDTKRIRRRASRAYRAKLLQHVEQLREFLEDRKRRRAKP